mmetsp:Transcript_1824/g.3108  ORF Transcript_1824/g.3108 Transcript_1824/m.3108 type:complete len:337 (-) Transcript_1824:1834-2844(-)
MSETPAVGDQVTLQGGTAFGIPLHREARSSRFAHAEPGTQAEVIGAHDNGRWLFLKLETARAWVLARNTEPAGASAPVATDTLDRSTLLHSECAGSNAQSMENTLFAICQDLEWRIPRWVGYVMRGDELDGPGNRHRSSWKRDDRVTPPGQANNRIYVGSGFHKGHLAPAQAYVRTQAAVDGTHIFTNAVPQFGSINSGAWAKLEAAVRHMAMDGADLWIVTGSLFVDIDPRCQKSRPPERCLLVDTTLEPAEPANHMRDEIAIPSHTYKAVLAEHDGVWSARAFIMPNIPRGAGKFRNYRFSVDQLEHMLGFDLFQSLPDDIETRIEERATPLSN